MTNIAPTPLEYAYVLEGVVYANVTSRCHLRCRFCFKYGHGPLFYGHRLLMTRAQEPSLPRLVEDIQSIRERDELVFCGLGEPLERRDVVLAVARRFRPEFRWIRINTSGQFESGGAESQAPSETMIEDLMQLARVVDELRISLNAPDAATYEDLCQPTDRLHSFPNLLRFVHTARALFGKVSATVVDAPGLDLARCRAVADELRVPLLVRPHVPQTDLSDAGRPPQVTRPADP